MKITATSSGPGLDGIFKGIAALNGSDVLVGIPEGDNRQDSLSALAGAMKLTKSGKLSKKAAKYLEAAKSPISNAELLFIFTNGSPLHGQPPRVVIEAAIEAEPTKSLIAKYLGMAIVAAMDGDESGMVANLKKAGTIGESASKRWFTDPRNGWAENAPSTIAAKGSDTPGIDTGQMRRAIISVVEAKHLQKSNKEEEKPQREADGATSQNDVSQSSVKQSDPAANTVGVAESAADEFGVGIESIGAGVEAGAETAASVGGEIIEGLGILL